MTKRLISLVLALVMVMAMIVVPTQATETEQETTYEAGYCQHCKTVIPEEQWTPWDVSDLTPKSGHYYLDRDVNDQAKQITISLDDDNLRHTVCLDLRGRTYTVEEFRPFLIYGIFSIMDSVGGGEISSTGQTSNAFGGFCQMGKSKLCNDAGVLNLYSGTIRKVNTAEQIVAYGGLVYATSGATFNMYGGKLIGGDVYGRLNSSGSPISPLGGTIHATGAYINLYGGTVTGGVANDTTLTLSDGTSKSYDAYGGNIYAEKSSIVTVAGGTVENGYSDTYGGNMTIKSSTLIVTAGNILGGYSEGAAGNINMSSSGAVFKMSGGVVKNGVCTTRGGNLFVNNTGIDMEITGGEIYGDMSVGVFKTFKLSGSPKIHMGLGNGLRLQSVNETKMDISGLTEGAEIYLDGVDQTFTGVLENAETYLSYFKEAIRADITVTENGELAVAQGTTGFCPHCYTTGEQATWTAWHNNSSTSTSLISEKGDAHYYLTATTTRKGVVSIGTSSVKTNDVVFDMAGKTWTTTDKKVFNLYSKLSLVDSVGGGHITGTGSAGSGANGGVIMGSGACSFNMYSGKLSRTVKSGQETYPSLMGGLLYIANTSSYVNIHGGTIANGIAALYNTDGGKGGNIYSGGFFNMTAGTICGGKAFANSYQLGDTTKLLVDSEGNASPKLGYGGNLYLYGTVNITGGHILGGNANRGGNIYFSSSTKAVSISDCVIRSGTANETDSLALGLIDPEIAFDIYGGNIYIVGTSSNRKALTLSNVILRDGLATGGALNNTTKKMEAYGGNIYISHTDLTLRDSVVTGGIAGEVSGDDGRGGNLYLPSSGACDVYDSVIADGNARSHGGNAYGPGGVKFILHSGLVCNGTAGTYGGNLYCSGLTMESGIITGGVSGSNGGNIFVYESDADAATPNYLNIAAAEGKPAPIISNGRSGAFGGNIAVRQYSVGTITGAIIENGTGDTKGGTASYNADNLYGNTGSTLTLTDTVIRGISDNNYSGNGIYAAGSLTLKGNTRVMNDAMNSCIFLTNEAALTVDTSFTGEAAVGFGAEHFANVEEPQGGALTEQNTATGVFTGKLYLDGHGDYDYGLPAVFAVENDSKLYVASTAVITPATESEEETIRWFSDTQQAVNAATEGSFVRLFASNNTATAGGDVTVDLNGNNLTLTGEDTVTVYGFDSKNDTYDETACGTLTATGVTVAPQLEAPNGNRYITVAGESGTTFHRLGQRVSSVVLRPSAAGIYYKGTWEYDSVLAEKISSFGMTISTDHMPGSDFLSDSMCMYTAPSETAPNTSVLVKNIVRAANPDETIDNVSRGTMPIYAATYVIVDNGAEEDLVIVRDDAAENKDGVSYDLKTVLQKVDLRWPKLTETQKTNVKAIYNIDSEGFKAWNLYNLVADINGTASVRPLKILTLGHSLAVDSGHMLNLVANAQGYDQPLEIATLYYSGCPLYKHVNYLTNDSPVYDLYVSSTTTPEKPPVITYDVTMKYAVELDDWDIIIMQGGVFEIGYDTTYTDGNIQTIQNYVNQYKTNPNAIFAWHMPWATPTDTTLRDQYPYTPNSYYTSYEAFNDDRTTFYNAITGAVGRNIVTDDSFVYLIPSGTAIENALSSYLEETDLHRDYAHVTDLGRVIASYTWYCTLAGIDELDAVMLDAIPKAFLKSTEDKTQDRVITDAEKAIILESVNNALAKPLEMTQSQYTTE